LLFVDINEVRDLVKSNVNVVKMQRHCRFNDSWTLSDEYTHWISRTKDVQNVRCTLYLNDIDVIAVTEEIL